MQENAQIYKFKTRRFSKISCFGFLKAPIESCIFYSSLLISAYWFWKYNFNPRIKIGCDFYILHFYRTCPLFFYAKFSPSKMFKPHQKPPQVYRSISSSKNQIKKELLNDKIFRRSNNLSQCLRKYFEKIVFVFSFKKISTLKYN